MYTITAVTGHVGGATARALIAADADVRAVVRNPDTGAAWAERGAEVAVADFTDQAALTAALSGSDGAFVMLPTIATASDAEHREMADSIAVAVADSAVPHVVMLSSVGADLPEGTGPIRWLHHLEHRLNATGVIVTAIRSPHFQEKVETVLPAAISDGVYPVFGDLADIGIPMVATCDVGVAAAEFLMSPPAASQVIDLDAPTYSEADVARQLGTVLGRDLHVVPIPRADWLDTLTATGMPTTMAAELVELFDAGHRGDLRPRSGHLHRCTTPLDDTLCHLVESYKER
jgi:uncharacterized protein YbjT (DUF2867 family)